MKKLFCFLIVILLINNLFAQSQNYTIAIDNFQKNFNTEKYDEIFNNFSPEMKSALPIESTRHFFNNLRIQAGKMEKKDFIEYQQGTYATYKTQFEKSILAINISLDKNDQINGFLIKPYTETQNKVSNALELYSKKIAGIIYSKTKDLPNNAQLSIAVIKDNKTSYYGIIKNNDSIKPIENQNKIFEIGSITKVFTSTVLASLIENNKLKRSDYINSYYPFPFKDRVTISFESLANHTSGLPRLPQNFDLSNLADPYKKYNKSDLDQYLKNLLQLDHKALPTYSYSNLGAGLLGYTLGVSQKTTFQDLLQKNVFDKYKMKNSFTNSETLGNRLVKGLNKNGETVFNWNFDVLFGAGGILSTTEDLAKFALAQFNPNNKELTLTRKPTFTVNDKMKIGLGWHILQSENNKTLVWHNGGTGGYSSSIAINIEDKEAVIILSNISEANTLVDGLCFELLKGHEL